MKSHFAAAPFGAKEIGITDSNTMRPMLVKFPLSRSFGICKATSLASPCKNIWTKIFRCIGSASSKRANFLQEKAKAQLIVYLLTSILTHYCDKFAFCAAVGSGFLCLNPKLTLWLSLLIPKLFHYPLEKTNEGCLKSHHFLGSPFMEERNNYG